MRLIDADALAAGFENEAFAIERSGRPILVAEVYRIMAKHLRNEGLCPTIDPVKHGHWVDNIRGDYCRACSNCGFGVTTNYVPAWLDCNRASDERETCIALQDAIEFCPNCGARMEVLPEELFEEANK